MDNTLLLIDGSSFIFRAFYAIKHLSAPSGIPTNAAYGVVSMIKQLQKKYTTKHWVCVFDAKGKTFRDEIYPEYKANRRVTPAELTTQIPYIHELINALGIPIIVQEGVEADDIIATIATQYAVQNYQVLIATGDKDFAQIVSPQIKLLNTMTNELLDAAGVETKFGVKPEQIIDYLSLIGDSADNVPGVHKCGPKTAQKWLQEYTSLDNLLSNQQYLTGAVAENLRQATTWLKTAKQLITIDTNVTISALDINQRQNITCQEPNWGKLTQIYQELGFRTWLKEAAAKHTQAKPSANFDLFAEEPAKTNQAKIATLVNNNQALNNIIDLIIQQNQPSAFYLFTEDYSNHLSAWQMLSITNATHVYLIPIHHNLSHELFSVNQDNNHEQLAILAKYFQGYNPKLCYNYKLVLHTLKTQHLSIQNIAGDLVLASYLHNSTANHTLSTIIQRLNPSIELESFEDKFSRGAKKIAFSQLDLSQQQTFVFNLTQAMLETHAQLLQQLSQAQLNLYTKVELPLSNLLFNIECAGMLIDKHNLNKLATEMRSQLNLLEQQVQQIAGCAFNLNSPKQVQDILFIQLKLPISGIKANSTGYSTNEESLNILAEQGYQIANLLLEHRFLSKLLNTYVAKLPNYADQNDLIHTSLEQTVVSSGRLSSKDPNLQNIPIRSNYGQTIRDCFIAKKNHQLICADYSQIELRILAHISGDTNLINAFKANADIHATTASQIFNKPIELVSKEERRYAKSINFGLIYGKSVFGLAKELKIERSAAKLYIDSYFANYPQVKQYMEQIKQQAHTNGYVESIYGRRVYLNNINSSNNILRQADERLALNAPMQSSAADIIKIAMLNISNFLSQQQLKTQMIMQVHDELIFQVPQDEVTLMLTELHRLMSEPITLAVPLEIAVQAAATWGMAH